MQARVWMLTSCVAWLAAAGCKPGAEPAEKSAPASVAADDGPDVLATVNGRPIRESELHYVVARKARGQQADALLVRRTLETLIDQELARQAAERQGLDAEAEYVRKLRFMQAPVTDFERDTLSQAYLKSVADQVAPVTEAEARKHFDENPDRYKIRYRFWQILVKDDDATLVKLKERLDGGEPFEQVAASLYTPEVLAAGKRFWELDALRWDQLPEPWQKALPSMKAGDISGILRGPNKRAWIVKLVERVEDEGATFEALKPTIMATLENARKEEQTTAAGKALRREATIDRMREPTVPKPPPDDDL